MNRFHVLLVDDRASGIFDVVDTDNDLRPVRCEGEVDARKVCAALEVVFGPEPDAPRYVSTRKLRLEGVAKLDSQILVSTCREAELLNIHDRVQKAGLL